MMKLAGKFISTLVLVLVIVFGAAGQVIEGPSPVNLNNTYTYTCTSTYLLLTPTWTTLRGSIVSQSQNGLVYSVTITWVSSGSGNVKLFEGDGSGHDVLVTQKAITVSSCTNTAPTVTNGSRCGTGTVTLSASPGSGGSSIRWYAAVSGGSVLATGTSYTTSSISTTTTYYATTYNSSNSCESVPRTPVVATVNPIPGQPTPTNGSRCGTGTVTLTATPGTNSNSIKWYSASTGGTLLYTGTSYTTASISSTTNYYITSYNTTTACESDGSRQQITATVNTIPTSPTTSGNHRFEAGTFTLVASGAPGSGNYKWYNPSGGLLYNGSSYTTPSVSSTTANYAYAVVVSAQNCESAPTWVTVNVYSKPVITTTNPNVALGASVTLDAGSGYDSYSWKNSSNVQVGTQRTFGTATIGDYSVTVTKSSVNSTSDAFSVKSQFDGQNMNYIVSETLLDSIKNDELIDALTVEQKNQTIQYFDELGRLTQAVITQGSPDKKDIVQPVVYDFVGREHRKYLPVVPDQSKGWYQTGIIDSQGNYAGAVSNFYNNESDNIADDSIPYAATIFEQSPLSRVIKQGAPGGVWQPDAVLDYTSSDHTIKNAYGFNAASDYVLKWTYTTAAGIPLGLVNAGTASSPVYHSANTLYKKITIDEHGNKVIEFKNKQDQIVLKKVQAGVSTYADTYYIYDQFKNLVCVIPPEAVARLSSEFYQLGSSNSSKNKFLKRWAFRFKYDGLSRMTAKQVPGGTETYLVYDKRDRLVLSQDGNLRSSKQWLFTKYDTLNRPVITGVYTHGSIIDQEAMSILIDTVRFCERYGSGHVSNHGYSNYVFPKTNLKILTVTYYDNYHFVDDFAAANYNFNASHLTGQEEEYFSHVRGRVTGAKINVLGSNNYLWNVNYYDENYRIIQTVMTNHKDSLNRVTNQYDFAGKILKTKSSINIQEESHEVTKIFDYDHAGRLEKTWHKIDDGDSVLIANNLYNEIGQLVTKNLHSRNNEDFAQTIEYRYNVRGWLTTLNDPASYPDRLFQFKLNYNNPTEDGGDAQFNGNISEAIWKTAGNDESSYAYSYDAMNRLTEASYFNHVRPSENGRYSENIKDGANSGYDLNGNIKKLQRYGKLTNNTYGLMDNLSYAYPVGFGNQVESIDDEVSTQTNENGFKELVETAAEYSYDSVGNMIADANKGIALIRYNYLNLPVVVKKSGADSIVYTYNAGGRKLRQQVFGSASKTTDYLGEFIFENDTLRFINHEEGRVLPDTASESEHVWEYQYHLKDHLGNVRATFSEKNLTTEYFATMETAAREEEESEFLNLEGSTFSNFGANNHTAGGNYSVRLSGNNGEVVGPAKSLEVNAGDIIDMEVYAKYSNLTNNNSSVSTLLASLIGAFNLSSSGGSGLTSEDAYNSFSTLFSSGPYVGSVEDYEDEEAPKAYLNWILFNGDFVPVDFGFDQISEEAGTGHELLSLHVKVPQAGYLYIYISNENDKMVDVFFDDFRVVHYTCLRQSDDYYPFGLTFNSYRKENAQSNKFKFQSQEEIGELDLNWKQFKWRNYDASIGRFLIIDPISDKYVYNSTYAFSENDVINSIELEGLETFRVINYSPMQSQKLRSLYGELDHLEKEKDKSIFRNADERKEVVEEIDRIRNYGGMYGFVDPNGEKSDYIIRKLKEAGVSLPYTVEQNYNTTIAKLIERKGDFILEYYGVTDSGSEPSRIGEINYSQLYRDLTWSDILNLIDDLIPMPKQMFRFPLGPYYFPPYDMPEPPMSQLPSVIPNPPQKAGPGQTPGSLPAPPPPPPVPQPTVSGFN